MKTYLKTVFWLPLLVTFASCETGTSGGSVSSALTLTYERQTCGAPQQVTLIAGQKIPVGTVTVWNDAEYLYVAYQTQNGWWMTETHLAVAGSLSGIPQRNGNPVPGQFPYKRYYNPPVQYDVYQIPLSTFTTTTLFVAAQAVVVRLNGDGVIVGQETAWANGPNFPGRNWAMYFQYTIQTCEPPKKLAFRTYTQGGWGAVAHGDNPGAYRDARFGACFPNGLVIGCAQRYTALFTSASAVEAFLPQGGPPGTLTTNLVDPLSSTGGVLAGQVLALSLNVGFDACDPNFSLSDFPLAGLVVADSTSPCFGLSVAEVLAQGNLALGGCPAMFSPSVINGCVSSINENFVDGTTNLGYLAFP